MVSSQVFHIAVRKCLSVVVALELCCHQFHKSTFILPSGNNTVVQAQSSFPHNEQEAINVFVLCTLLELGGGSTVVINQCASR